ncbi:MAG: hypothetical protein ACPGYT_03005 [Nitrospirales bacterium]
MDKLLPNQLKQLWQRQDQQSRSAENCYIEQERLIDRYRNIWVMAQCRANHQDLKASILDELGQYMECDDLSEIQHRCQQAVSTLKKDWEGNVTEVDRKSVEQFYDESHAVIYELMWWHTLSEDVSPLAYVTALELAQQHGCHEYLDFGAGVGSGGILFASHGFHVTLADISSPLQQFSQWRFNNRVIPADFFRSQSRSFT